MIGYFDENAPSTAGEFTRHLVATGMRLAYGRLVTVATRGDRVDDAVIDGIERVVLQMIAATPPPTAETDRGLVDVATAILRDEFATIRALRSGTN